MLFRSEQIKSQAELLQLPIEAHLLKPIVKDTFWSNLIGKGYPAPRNGFRWCTDRLKINPANRFIREVVQSNGETILVLGTRKAESSKRAMTNPIRNYRIFYLSICRNYINFLGSFFRW